MGARPYDPSLGRFYAVDPVDGGSVNAYDYAAQDPVNAYDLLGAFVSFGGDGGDINALDECNIVVIRKPSYCRPPLPLLPPLPTGAPSPSKHRLESLGKPQRFRGSPLAAQLQAVGYSASCYLAYKEFSLIGQFAAYGLAQGRIPGVSRAVGIATGATACVGAVLGEGAVNYNPFRP